MRPRKTEAEKKKLGRPSYRTFYNQIGFQVAKSLHAVMRDIAKERNIRLEDIYAEAVRDFLEMRSDSQILYTPAPIRRFATRLAIHIEPYLEEAVRAACLQDQQQLGDFFQTAVWLYLKELGRLSS